MPRFNEETKLQGRQTRAVGCRVTMEQRRFPTRPCPVCRSERSKLLFRQSFAQLSVASLMDDYNVVICEQCGAGFADDIPAQSVFDEYYRDLSKYEDAAPSGYAPPPVDQRFRDIAGVIEPFVTAPDSRI